MYHAKYRPPWINKSNFQKESGGDPPPVWKAHRTKFALCFTLF